MRIAAVLTLGCGLALTACEQEAPAPEPAQPVETQTATPAAVPRKPSPAGAIVYFVSPADGEQVTSPVSIVFGLAGAGVAPAGIDLPNTGHHHLLVDTDPPPSNLPIPADAQHVHFGLGQTETTLDLSVGEHSLQLLLGDNLHVPHDPPLMSERITVRVVE